MYKGLFKVRPGAFDFVIVLVSGRAKALALIQLLCNRILLVAGQGNPAGIADVIEWRIRRRRAQIVQDIVADYAWNSVPGRLYF